MKKLICFGLALMMLMAAFSAYADSEMDAVFDSGSPTLSEVTGEFDFKMTEETVSLLKESDEELRVVSISPVGYSGIFTLGKSMLTVYDEKLSVVHPSSEQGVKDEYGNLDRYYNGLNTDMSHLIGEEGVVYSPDGKYAFIGNRNQTLMYMKLYIDPILLDLSTGELILTATYPGKLSIEGSGAVTSGMFSADGRYFYYTFFGRSGEMLISVYRYDLTTGETELCFQSDKNLYYPHLSELSDGSLLMLNEARRNDEKESLVIAKEDNGSWTLQETELPLDRTCLYADELNYAAGTGLVCLTEKTDLKETFAFQIINPGKNFEGLDRILCVTKDTNEIVSLSPEEFQKAMEDECAYQEIHKAVFSPDGHYLLLHALGDSANLLLVRLEDMAVVKVGGLDAVDINSGVMSRRYPVCIEWNAYVLVIGTKDGIRPFTFDTGKP